MVLCNSKNWLTRHNLLMCTGVHLSLQILLRGHIRLYVVSSYLVFFYSSFILLSYSKSSLTTASPHKLIGAAFVDYAKLLRSIGLKQGAVLWASRAGEAGKELLDELSQKESMGLEPSPSEEEVDNSLGNVE